MMRLFFMLITVWSLCNYAHAVSTIIKGDGVAETKERIKIISKAAQHFYADCGFYPKSIYGLIVDIDKCKNWGPEPYVMKTETLSDVWSRPLVYRVVSKTKFEIKSLGPVDSDKKSPRGEIKGEIKMEDQNP